MKKLDLKKIVEKRDRYADEGIKQPNLTALVEAINEAIDADRCELTSEPDNAALNYLRMALEYIDDTKPHAEGSKFASQVCGCGCVMDLFDDSHNCWYVEAKKLVDGK